MNMQLVPGDRTLIYLLFYKPSLQDPFQNQLVARFDGPYCHVEMAFADRCGEEPWERELWGTSIYQNETVFFKPKTYKREGYFSISIEVTLEQMLKIRKYCQSEAKKQVGFSMSAMYAASLSFFQLVHTDLTFCSKHITLALQHGGVMEVEGVNASLMSPSKLYRTFTTKARVAPVLQVLPSKRKGPEVTIQCSQKMVQSLLAQGK